VSTRPPSSSGRLATAATFAFIATAGVLAAGGVGLWRAARDARALAESAAEQSLWSAVRAMQSWLVEPARVALEPLDPGAFVLREGRLALNDAVAPWRLDAADPELALPGALIEPLDAADAAEARGDGAAADAAFAVALERAAARPDRERAFLLHAAARAADRRGDATVRDARLDELVALLESPATAAAEPPHFATVVAGALLLAACGEEAAFTAERIAQFHRLEPLDRPLAGLPPALAAAVVARAREVAPSWFAEAFAVAHARVVERAAVAALLAPHVARLVAAPGPLAWMEGERLVVYLPDADGEGDPPLAGTGRGAVRSVHEWLPGAPAADGTWPLDDARLAPGGAVRLVARSPLPRDAVAIVPGLGVLPRDGGGAPPFATTGGLAALLAVLGAALVGALLLVVRTVRREAAATAARGRFLTSVTHELKTPLASIRLLSEMLADGRAPAAKQDEYHRLLAGEAERLSALIENVLDAGELDRGERALDLAPHRIDDVVRDVVQRVAPLLERAGLQVALQLPDAQVELAVDRGALAQIVINLLDNARKYAAASGTVDVELDAPGDGRVRLRVRDRGPGIDAADRASLFEPFVRGARQRDGATPGLGLGLHLARSLARRHGGELACVAPADGGAGACFELTLPAANAAANGAKR